MRMPWLPWQSAQPLPTDNHSVSLDLRTNAMLAMLDMLHQVPRRQPDQRR